MPEDTVMRKIYFALAAAAAVLTVSCAKEIAIDNTIEEPTPVGAGKVSMTFQASAEDAGTKVALDTDGKTAKWEADDEIAVFDCIGTTFNLFTANSAGTTTSFTGTVDGSATNFVAVYPSSAALSLGEGDKPISAIIPPVQEATLGSFDPAAALYVAESTDLDAKFAFKAAFALLKVNVDVDNVIEVSVENTERPFAGSVFVSTGGGVSNGAGTTFKKVTLKKSDDSALAKGVYYIVVRHLGESSTYTGFKLTYSTSDAMMGERTSATVIDNSMLARKSVLSLGSLSAVPAERSWYAFYQAGNDITIGSKTINKATNGDATLWTAENAVYTLGKTPMETGGIFFLKSVGTGSFTLANNPTITAMTCLISDSDEKADVTFANVFNLADDGKLYLKGVNATMTGSKNCYFSVNKNTSKSASDIVIDNCKFATITGTPSIVNTNSSFKTYGVKNIEMVNSLFAIGIASTLVTITSSYAGIAEYQSMTFSNNFVYSTTGANFATSIFNYTGTTGNDMAFVINNNLFYNTVAAGTVKNYSLSSVTATKNVYSAADASGLGANAKMFSIKVVVPSPSVADNVGFGALADGKSWTIADKDYKVGMEDITVAPSDPVASVNTTTGTFTMATGYESYGPQL